MDRPLVRRTHPGGPRTVTNDMTPNVISPRHHSALLKSCCGAGHALRPSGFPRCGCLLYPRALCRSSSRWLRSRAIPASHHNACSGATGCHPVERHTRRAARLRAGPAALRYDHERNRYRSPRTTALATAELLNARRLRRIALLAQGDDAEGARLVKTFGAEGIEIVA